MVELTVLIPVLKRPHRVKPLLDSLEATTDTFEATFIADSYDIDEIDAIVDDGRGKLLLFDGSYPEKINFGIAHSLASYIFLGADDLEFQPNWFEAAKAKMGNGVEAVGVNDMLKRDRDHQTHFLITYRYGCSFCIDKSRGPLYEGYDHWYCDDEFIATAKHRNAYAYAEDSLVKHLHPVAGLAQDDWTYIKGRQMHIQDARLFGSRAGLWTT